MSWRNCASSLLILLAAAAPASCGSAAPGGAEPRARTVEHAPRMLERLSHTQRREFALLRTRPEGLPKGLGHLPNAEDAAINRAMAQRIPVMVPGSYWLAPGIGSLCILSEVPGTPGIVTVCASTREVLQHGLGTISFPSAGPTHAGPPTRLLVGIAPDGARAALVHTDGSVAAVPVVGGVFVLRDSRQGASESIELRRTRGRRPHV
ncbi:MAG: hypothetical protein JSS99_12010 [Actinobacteria bacterium]|nr:hypothetical protein [Actinomycetota bacterium]